MTLGSDDYHQHVKVQKINGLLYDQYGYAYENCTSYNAIQTEFDMGLSVLLLGGAASWPLIARLRKLPVDGIPRLWSYACFAPNTHGAGPKGHVGLVQGVNSDGTFNISEYNFDHPLQFGERFTLSADGVEFIHYYSAAPPVPTPTPLVTGEDNEMLIIRADNGDYFLAGGKMVAITTPLQDAKLTNVDHVPIWDVRGDTVQYERLRAAYPAQ